MADKAEGDALQPTEYLENGNYRMCFESDGDMMVFNTTTSQVTCAIWPYGTTLAPDELVYETDGA